MTVKPTDKRITVRELQRNMSHVFQRVIAGEDVTVTRHGKAVVRITLPDSSEEEVQKLIDEGVLQVKSVDELLPASAAAHMRPEPSPPETSLATDALLALRDEERW